MDLTPNADQEAFVTATADWCRDNMPLENARERSPDLWTQMREMGWLGMTHTDLGLDHATEALVFAELGRHLAPIGALSTAVARRWTGTERRVGLVIPAADTVRILDGTGASLALGLRDGDAFTCALPAELASAASLDPSATLARLASTPALTPLGEPRAALHLQLLAAAYAVGCADAARDMASDYAKMRQQFDRPIGWFQAIKHLCADMAVRAAVARSQLYFAACALDAGGADAAFHIAAAKHLADQAAVENSRANVQIHGAIGITDEAYPHFCLKRAHLLTFVAPASRQILLDDAA
ncbi:acyl-CoA dehydrogenase family protein [Parapedomonas caeni]